MIDKSSTVGSLRRFAVVHPGSKLWIECDALGTADLADDICKDRPEECSVSYTERSVQKYEHIWILENFRSYLEDPDSVVCLRSSSFVIATDPPSEWQIACYPKGHYSNSNGGISLQLEYLRGDKDMKVRVLFAILDEKDLEKLDGSIFCEEQYNTMPLTHINYDSVLRNLSSNGALNIKVTIFWMSVPVTKSLSNITNHSAHLAIEGQRQTSLNNLSSDLQRLLESGDRSDAVIRVVDGRHCSEIHAHKLILASRSPVFAAMLAGNTKENQLGVIEIEDLMEGTMRNLLLFMYTGRVNDDCSWIDMYKAADKYALEDLKKIAESKLLLDMNMDNACAMLRLADMHGGALLKEKSIQFINRHIDSILDTDGWAQTISCSPTLVTDIIRAGKSSTSNLSPIINLNGHYERI